MCHNPAGANLCLSLAVLQFLAFGVPSITATIQAYYRPLVLMHGMNNNPSGFNAVVSALRAAYPGIYINALDVMNNRSPKSVEQLIFRGNTSQWCCNAWCAVCHPYICPIP